MSTLYLVALIALSIVFIGVMVDAVLSVSRKPAWQMARPRLELVETMDRRTQDLPFVGRERRQGAGTDEAEPESIRA